MFQFCAFPKFIVYQICKFMGLYSLWIWFARTDKSILYIVPISQNICFCLVANKNFHIKKRSNVQLDESGSYFDILRIAVLKQFHKSLLMLHVKLSYCWTGWKWKFFYVLERDAEVQFKKIPSCESCETLRHGDIKC